MWRILCLANERNRRNIRLLVMKSIPKTVLFTQRQLCWIFIGVLLTNLMLLKTLFLSTEKLSNSNPVPFLGILITLLFFRDFHPRVVFKVGLLWLLGIVLLVASTPYLFMSISSVTRFALFQMIFIPQFELLNYSSIKKLPSLTKTRSFLSGEGIHSTIAVIVVTTCIFSVTAVATGLLLPKESRDMPSILLLITALIVIIPAIISIIKKPNFKMSTSGIEAIPWKPVLFVKIRWEEIKVLKVHDLFIIQLVKIIDTDDNKYIIPIFHFDTFIVWKKIYEACPGDIFDNIDINLNAKAPQTRNYLNNLGIDISIL